ncbi:hypothetical protein ABZ470_38380 [Streptosporangium sp. NPDC020072]|uniref:hypothetical protein n=1 Tax=Streptosporangium sp. NPDC020072 TaxID=3154788 RepID=UPI0034406E71
MGGTVKAATRTTRPTLTLVRGTGETAAKDAGRGAAGGGRPVARPRGTAAGRAGRTVPAVARRRAVAGGRVAHATVRRRRAPVRLTRRGRVVAVLALVLLVLAAFWAGALLDAALAS